uniref:Protein kinase domain-containing protein n=1 Tax=Caenorhabditis tropicalis TaxID=1561998 RepID=A0A1I7TP06_9PELO
MSMFFKKKSKKAKLESAPIVKVATNRLYSESDSSQDSDTLVGGNSSQLVPGVYLDNNGVPDSTFVNAPSSVPESSSQSTRVIDVIPEIGTVPASDFFSAFFTRPGDPLPLWQVVTDGKIRWMKYAHSSLAKPQLSSAKDHELVEAEERMKEYLAGLQLKLPPSASLNIKLKKSDDSDERKQGSQTKPAEEASQKDHPSNVGKAPVQISPSREHEIEEAQKLMDDYFAKLNEKHMIAAQATPSTDTSSPADSLATPTKAFLTTKNDKKKLLAVVQSQESIPKPTAPPPAAGTQISPAKANEIAEAQRRMGAFLATKNAGKKLLAVVPPQESVVTPTVSTATTEIGQTVVSKVPTVLVKPTVNGQDARFKPSKGLSPAKPDEIAEAQKRMDAFLANKSGAKKALQVTPQAAPEVKVNSASGKVLPTLNKPKNIDVEKAMTTPVKTAPQTVSEELIVPKSDVASQKKLNMTLATNKEIEETNKMNKMDKSFGSHIQIQPRSADAPQVVQPVAPSLCPMSPIPTFAPLSDSVCPKKLMTQLKVLEEEHNRKMAEKLMMPTTIQSPVRMRPCISKPDMLENVPDYIEHSKTPYQTPLKMRLDKNERPRRFAMTVKGIFRKRILQLVAPIRRRRSVTCGDAPDLSRPQLFDDSVNEGSSGFRVRSVVDHETNTIRFPKYNAPGTSTQH